VARHILNFDDVTCHATQGSFKSSPTTHPWRRSGERRYTSYSFTTSALHGGEWSASRPCRVLPRGKDPWYSLYRRLGGPQNRLDTEATGKVVFFTCRKMLRHGASGFTFRPKDGVLWICIAIKNHSARPGLNPRPMNPVASTLTTTRPRRPVVSYTRYTIL
jgi:hypothetical protein